MDRIPGQPLWRAVKAGPGIMENLGVSVRTCACLYVPETALTDSSPSHSSLPQNPSQANSPLSGIFFYWKKAGVLSFTTIVLAVNA